MCLHRFKDMDFDDIWAQVENGKPMTVTWLKNLAVQRAALTFQDDTSEEYVNPKQYNRILKRRKVRQNMARNSVVAKRGKYLHESRHRHAKGRRRGPSGKFVRGGEEEEGSGEKGVFNASSGKKMGAGGGKPSVAKSGKRSSNRMGSASTKSEPSHQPHPLGFLIHSAPPPGVNAAGSPISSAPFSPPRGRTHAVPQGALKEFSVTLKLEPKDGGRLGLRLTQDAGTGSITVYSFPTGSVVARSGVIMPYDYLSAVNGVSVVGYSLRAVLARIKSIITSKSEITLRFLRPVAHI